MATDRHLDRITDEFRKDLSEKKEMQDILIEEVKKRTIGDIEERLRNMVEEANKNLERLKAYNEVINRLIAAQNKMLKRINVLEEISDNFKKVKALMIGITVLASGFTIANGAIALAKFFSH